MSEAIERIRGKSMRWDYDIEVSLPPSYHLSEQAYPVLWVLDGSFYSKMAGDYAHMFARGVSEPAQIPEMIVISVCVPEQDAAEYATRRLYDFSPYQGMKWQGHEFELYDREWANYDAVIPRNAELGGAEAFLSFVGIELRQQLAQKYRMADDHTLFGHSGGGNFCAYALFSKPELFQRIICGSPGFYAGEKFLFNLENDYAQTHDDLDAKVFFGAGEREAIEGGIITGCGVVSSTARMVETLTLRQYPSLEMHFKIFPGEDHLSVISSNLMWGLKAVWSASSHH